MDAIDFLTWEHEVIKILLNSLEVTVRERKPELPLVTEILTHLKSFADKTHHGKEEHLLFKDLLRTREAEMIEAVECLEEEHKTGRRLIAQMEQLVSDSRVSVGSARLLQDEADAYIQLLRPHIQKEDCMLFPLAEELLGSRKLEILGDKFKVADWSTNSGYRHADTIDAIILIAKKCRIECDVEDVKWFLKGMPEN